MANFRPTEESLKAISVDALSAVEKIAAEKKAAEDHAAAIATEAQAGAVKKIATAEADEAIAKVSLIDGASNGNGNGNGNGNNGNNGNNRGDRRNFFTGGGHLGWFPLAVLLLVLATVIALAWFKADKSQIDRLDTKVESVDTKLNAKVEIVDGKVNQALILGEKNKTSIGALKKDVERVNDKADKALNKPCANVCRKDRPAKVKTEVVKEKAVDVVQVAIMPPGGCIYTSDGTAVLKGKTSPLASGIEIARIPNADLVKIYPFAFDSDVSHLKACSLWSDSAAERLQEPKGLRVNKDTHRIQN